MRFIYKNIPIYFTSEVYEPSEDSYLLAEAARSAIKSPELVLEVGCGTGIVSAVIKSSSGSRVIGIDINPHAVICAKENGLEVIRGDLLSCIKGKFDTIVFNPPYLPTGENEKIPGWRNTALDGGFDGRQLIFRFLENAAGCLVEKGKVLLLLSSLTGIDEIKSRLRSLDFSVRELVQENFMFEKLVVIVATK